jgi:radical SAM superfamily enzyme YgiQ (UPF0313 family)
MRIKDIQGVVKDIQDAGIRVIGNFIFGLPDDNLETMQETLDLAVKLNCEFVNFYYGMAYPGSKLYDIAKANNWELPGSWHGFSQHSYEALPLATKFLSAKEVLKFRDEDFVKYYHSARYQNMILDKFGEDVLSHIKEMLRHKLKRQILGDRL